MIVAEKEDQITNEGLRELAKLPKIRDLNLWGLEFITDEAFKDFTSLKSLELHFWDISNIMLIRIAETCLQLQSLNITCKYYCFFLYLNLSFRFLSYCTRI